MTRLSTREAKGCTVREVPRMMSKWHLGKLSLTHLGNYLLLGKLSTTWEIIYLGNYLWKLSTWEIIFGNYLLGKLFLTHLSTREAKGCTVREVPRMMSKSHLGKSDCRHWKNFGGRPSPKKTMSGLTTPAHEVQLGTRSANISSGDTTTYCQIC